MSITMWENADARCMVLMVENVFNVQMLAGGLVLRERRVESADEAILLAGNWKTVAPPLAQSVSVATKQARAGLRGARPNTRRGSVQSKDPAAKMRTTPNEAAQQVVVRRCPMAAARGIIW